MMTKYDEYKRLHCAGCVALDTVVYVHLALIENGFDKNKLIFSEGSPFWKSNRERFREHRCFRILCRAGVACTYKADMGGLIDDD